MIKFLRRRMGLVLVAAATAAATTLTPGLANAAGTYSLLILPDQGETQIYNFINSAKSTIDMTMYELTDTTVVNDLVNQEKAGVKVRVILDQAEKSVNQTAFNSLQSGGVAVTFSSTAFTFTHQKTVTVDGAESFITTGNLDSRFYSTSRDYGVFDTDANDVAAVEAVFNADFNKTSITPSDGDDLVWSPTDSQSKLLALIQSATKTLDVEEEEFSDTTLVNAVVADAKRGVKVRVVLETPSSYSSEVSEVQSAGGTVVGYSDPNGFYIHAKAIVVDFGTSGARVFEGSENFSDNSLNDNRELGMIISDSGVLNGIEQSFNSDFSGAGGGGTTGTVTVTSPGNQTTTVGSSASVQISASDTAGGTLSYSATGLPAGLSINASSGLISGKPTTAGTSSVTVTATDSTGPSGSASFTWTVNAAGANTVTVTNPGSQTGTVGTAASLQISATDSASGQTLSYSATGLPAGLSISSSTGVISGTPTTAGTSSVTVTAKDTTGASGSASFSWTVDAASGGGCTAAQLIGNPGFETGTAAPWSITSSSGTPEVVNDNSDEPPHSGKWDAWLDGFGTTHTDTVSQSITVPSGCSTYTFSFWLHIDTAETSTTTAFDTLTVTLGGTTLATFSNLNHNTGYTQHSFNVSADAGQTVTLTFTGSEDHEKQTSFVIDDTALNVS